MPKNTQFIITYVKYRAYQWKDAPFILHTSFATLTYNNYNLYRILWNIYPYFLYQHYNITTLPSKTIFLHL